MARFPGVCNTSTDLPRTYGNGRKNSTSRKPHSTHGQYTHIHRCTKCIIDSQGLDTNVRVPWNRSSWVGEERVTAPWLACLWYYLPHQRGSYPLLYGHPYLQPRSRHLTRNFNRPNTLNDPLKSPYFWMAWWQYCHVKIDQLCLTTETETRRPRWLDNVLCFLAVFFHVVEQWRTGGLVCHKLNLDRDPDRIFAKVQSRWGSIVTEDGRL